MLKSIIERHNKLTPLTETEIKIIECATRLFLERGFTKTTHRMIAGEAGLGLGTVTYHYRTKEDMLRLLIEELMDYHLDVIEKTSEDTDDHLYAYAIEIAVQMALCEGNAKARDLYHSAYNHPETFNYIKDWGARKNFTLLSDKAPHLTELDFRDIENVTAGMELVAIMTPSDRYFTFSDKVKLFLDNMMKAYDITQEDRKATIEKILSLNLEQIASDLFEKFVKRLDNNRKDKE